VQNAKRSFLLAVVTGMNLHARNDAPKRISAKTVTMRRLGPSRSRKKKNNTLEHTNAVTTRRSKDVRFDSNGILFIIEYFSRFREDRVRDSEEKRFVHERRERFGEAFLRAEVRS
jgi:hypothetical protein